jgi:hypothetical protein
LGAIDDHRLHANQPNRLASGFDSLSWTTYLLTALTPTIAGKNERVPVLPGAGGFICCWIE